MSRRLWWVGAFAGAAAGTIYLMAEQVLAALTGQPVDAPFRLFASMLLGQRALSASVSSDDAFLIGTLVTLIATTVLGVFFAGLVCHFSGLAATPGTLLIAGLTYGAALWLLTFYVLGYLFWPWLTRTSPTIQLAAAAIGYGLSLGALLVLAGIHRSSELE